VKRGLLVVAALIVGTVLANTLLPENGYVAISFLGRLVEMSVPTFVLLLLLALALLQGLLTLTHRSRRRASDRLLQRRARAREDLDQGLLEMAAGRWEESEVTLTRGARDAAQPAVHYLVAARAAELLGRADRRDAWLAMAREAAPDAPGPVLVMQAETHLKHGQVDAALEALQALEQLGRLGPRPLLLLARAYRQRGDFEKLRQLEPRLRDTRGVRSAQVDEIMDNLYLDMLKVAAERGGLPAVEAVWDEATRAARRRPAIVVACARALARHGRAERAAGLLEELLDDEWHEPAATLYGELEAPDPLARLRKAEGWLRARREDPALLVACARLCVRAEIYGKARSYLETSFAVKRRPETAQLLARLLEQLGDRERAIQVLTEGLAASTGRRADLAVKRGQSPFSTPRTKGR
jgi:HemY protein